MAPSVRCALVGLALLLGACSAAPLKQYRTVTDGFDVETGEFLDGCVRSANAETDACSVEERVYSYRGEERQYYFATVEFDDQGWFWDRAQLDALMQFLWLGPGGHADNDYLLFVFAHGWHHDASGCDNNVVCFQRMLERLDAMERAFVAVHNEKHPEDPRSPRTVLGVYLGWRGCGARDCNSYLSFYDRKAAGLRVGAGGVTELLTRVDDFRRSKNPNHIGRGTLLLIAGHSFGGQVIYRAVAQPLVERAVSMRRDRGTYDYEVARSIGDLVILLNPAFEGSLYEPLQYAATHRCYEPRQWPVSMIVTSTADSATATAFPLGRRLSQIRAKTRRDVGQRETVLSTVGHLDRYTTHRLELFGDAPAEPPKQYEDGPCGCPYLRPSSDAAIDELAERDQEFFRALDVLAEARGADPGSVYELDPRHLERDPQGRVTAVEPLPGGVAGFTTASYGTDLVDREMVLTRTSDDGGGEAAYAANYPYLVVSTDAAFIPSHNLVYGERFTDFLRRFFFRHLASKVTFPAECFTDPSCTETPVTPCGRSSICRVDREPLPQGCPRPY